MTITITLDIPALMAMPGDAIIRILDQAKPSKEFLESARAYENRENHGKGRWPVNNHLRILQAMHI